MTGVELAPAARRRRGRAALAFVVGVVLLISVLGTSRCGLSLRGGSGGGGEPDVRTSAARIALAASPGKAVPLWVYFDPAATVNNGAPALSAAALERRHREGVPLLPGDRPLPAELLARLEANGARVRYVSRWLRAASVWADSAAAERIARLPAVRAVARVGALDVVAAASGSDVASEERGWQAAAGEGMAADSAEYGSSWSWLRQVDVPAAHALGLTGQGVTIALLDRSFETAHVSLAGATVLATRNFVGGGSDVRDPAALTVEARHGTQVWSLLAARAPGTLVGAAYGASFLLARVDVEPGDTRADEDRWVAALEWADSLGARIVNSSLAYRERFTDRGPFPYPFMDGATTVTSVAAAAAAARGILVVSAVGNGGPAPGSLWAPADAAGIIAVGAVDAAGAVLPFSGRGPTFDGRIKPELVARGTGLVGAGLAPGMYDSGLAGTSHATPLVTGAAALVMQAWPTLTAAQVRAALLGSGSRAASPDNAVGRGVPSAAGAVFMPAGLATGAVSTVDVEGRSTTAAPQFTWQVPLIFPALRPVRYTLEVARDPAFAQVVYADTVTGATVLRARRALRPAPALYWRVHAVAPDGTRRLSNVAGPFSVPEWVRLTTFASETPQFTQTQRPVLSWTSLEISPPAGPFLFDVELFRHADGRVVRTFLGVTGSSLTVDPPLDHNVAYRWRVIARAQGGAADTAESRAPFVVTSDEQPPATLLYQNFPNPFPRADLGHTLTRVWFDLSERAAVELAIYDLRGRLVRRLIPGNAGCGAVTLAPGIYGRDAPGTLAARDGGCVQTAWDGTDDGGRRMPAGVYLLRLRANGFEQVKRMIYQP